MPIAPLVSSDDSDLASWQAGDQDSFLAKVCESVRVFCGWHIAPSVSVSSRRYWVKEGGLVMLPSTHVTCVEQVAVGYETRHVLTPFQDYSWEEPKGWLRVHAHNLPGGFYSWHEPHVFVSYTHGHAETPEDVRAVIYEVLATALELPASNASEVMTEHYRFNLKSTVGVSLSDDQKNRLGKYRVRRFGGLVRP